MSVVHIRGPHDMELWVDVDAIRAAEKANGDTYPVRLKDDLTEHDRLVLRGFEEELNAVRILYPKPSPKLRSDGGAALLRASWGRKQGRLSALGEQIDCEQASAIARTYRLDRMKTRFGSGDDLGPDPYPYASNGVTPARHYHDDGGLIEPKVRIFRRGY